MYLQVLSKWQKVPNTRTLLLYRLAVDINYSSGYLDAYPDRANFFINIATSV